MAIGIGKQIRTAALICLAWMATSATASVPSVPGADAPELAKPGPSQVGFRSVTFVDRDRPDVEHADAKSGAVAKRDRPLAVDIWYPARHAAGAKAETYDARFWGEPPHPPVAFSVQGMAVGGATPTGTLHPLVIVSHGYSNAPAAMVWLTENLASKGYVVAAIHHDDPDPYVAAATVRSAPNLNRPLDIAFVARRLRATLGTQIDPERVALIGYSQGGYGVLTAGGATLDPSWAMMEQVPGGWLKRHARGAADASALRAAGVKAIVAIAPGGGGPDRAWGADGLAAITAPLLLIAGDADPVVGYAQGAKGFFDSAINADRYLLTYRQAGHAIALVPVPAAMRGTLWDIDWFEDPIWRQDRLNAINLHFITAFLGAKLCGEKAMLDYLDVPVANSDDGVWSPPAGTSWGAFSPGGAGVTLWKGFQQRHARGMTLQHIGAARSLP